MSGPSLLQAVKALSNEIGISPVFLLKLRDEDDWSFIIKSHAFLEAAVSHLITVALSLDELGPIFSRLEMSNSSYGKVEFAKALGILGKDERRFIRSLSSLRNDLVHDVRNVGFDLREYVEELDINQFKSFVASFGYFADAESFIYDGRTIQVIEFVRDDPKQAIWFSLINLTGIIYIQKDSHRLDQIISVIRQSQT
jgi:hypothetical protein